MYSAQQARHSQTSELTAEKVFFYICLLGGLSLTFRRLTIYLALLLLLLLLAVLWSHQHEGPLLRPQAEHQALTPSILLCLNWQQFDSKLS